MSEYVLELNGISKSFPGVKALDDVTLRIRPGEVHALVGENGAGKSTLLKIMFGIMPPDGGAMLLDGRKITPHSPRDAQLLGISLVHQELQQIPELSVAQNIFLARELTYPDKMLVDRRKTREAAAAALAHIGERLDVRVPIKRLSIAQRQMVEIAKALLGNTRVIAFDEPTSSLTDVETANLFKVICDLRERGVGIIYVSHRIEEIMQIADTVTVLRDGRWAGEAPIGATTQAEIIRMMVGKTGLRAVGGEADVEVEASRVPPPPADAPEMLRVVGLRTHKLKNISFDLKRGEILGFAGLIGSGRTETMRAVFGADRYEGEIYVAGRKAHIRSPEDAIRYRIGFLPEDRKGYGLVRLLPVKLNIGLSSLPRLEWFGLLNNRRIAEECRKYVAALRIEPPYIDRLVMNLSGGNQQKVIVARWLLVNSEILIFDEPTRGIDVGAKSEIHHLMEDLALQGKAIIMVSSELPEVLAMSHRVVVMREGEIAKILTRTEANKETIMHYATGGK